MNQSHTVQPTYGKKGKEEKKRPSQKRGQLQKRRKISNRGSLDANKIAIIQQLTVPEGFYS